MGLLQVIKDQGLVIARAKPDGLRGFRCHDIRLRHRNLRYGIAVNREPGQGGGAILPGDDVIVIAVVNAFDLKVRAGHDLLGLAVALQNGQVRQLVIDGSDGDRASAIDIRLIHMHNDRLRHPSVGGGRRHLNEGVEALGDIGDGDLAGGVGLLSRDDLSISQDIEDGAFQRPLGVVQLQQFELDFGIVLKYQIHVCFSIPVEGLPYFVRITAHGVAVGRSDLSGDIVANGHGIPRHILEIAAGASRVGANEFIVDALDFDHGASQALGGVIGIDLADTAFAGDNRGISEGHGDSRFPSGAGQNDILGAGVIDLVSLRRVQLRDGIGAGIQREDRVGAVRAGDDLLGVAAVLRCDEEPSAGQSLVLIGGIHLAHGQLVLLAGDGQFTDHDGLDIVCGVVAGARPGVSVLVHCAVTPDTLPAKVEDVLGAVAERPAVQLVVNAGVAGMLQVIVDVHQLFRAGDGGIGEQICFVAPHHRLHPGVHGPRVVRAPDLIHAQGMRLVREDALGVGVKVGHHDFHGLIGNRLGAVPGMAFQGPAHTRTLLGTKAHDAVAIYIELHLMHIADAERRRLIVDTVVSTVIQSDGFRAGGECSCREQAQHTNQDEQHRCEPGMQSSETLKNFHFAHAPLLVRA